MQVAKIKWHITSAIKQCSTKTLVQGDAQGWEYLQILGNFGGAGGRWGVYFFHFIYIYSSSYSLFSNESINIK